MHSCRQLFAVAITLVAMQCNEARAAAPWIPDLGNGNYKNPVLAADYSDPDVVRVGDDFYLTASSFTNIPGLPVLHSKDLVNWTLIGHALTKLPPYAHYTVPRHGGGVWAPAIRYRDGKFYIYYPDPDYGIYVVTAHNPAGPWTEPVLVDPSRGAIDPAPFWDDDGSAWLVVAWAKSRAGINNIVTLKRMSSDGMRVLDEGKVIIDGNTLGTVATSNGTMPWITIEGPKLYKIDGTYYLFCPAGGVKPGWQGVFRAKKLDGPWEGRNVLDQGKTVINGPHQGGWVRTPTGEDWFLNFQDTDTYGRRVHLQPVQWKNGWPVIGHDRDGDGRGEPVSMHRKPKVGNTVITTPQTDDEFEGSLSLAWQWQANPQEDWLSLTAAPGQLRLKSVSASANFYEVGSLLTQKLPAPNFMATTKLKFTPKAVGEQAGLVIFGYDYAWIGLTKTDRGLRLVQNVRIDANKNGPEVESVGIDVPTDTLYLRLSAQLVTVPATPPEELKAWPSMTRASAAKVRFSYSMDGKDFIPLGGEFLAKQGRWVGAQFGIFSMAAGGTPANTATSVGYADFDWFHVAPL